MMGRHKKIQSTPEPLPSSAPAGQPAQPAKPSAAPDVRTKLENLNDEHQAAVDELTERKRKKYKRRKPDEPTADELKAAAELDASITDFSMLIDVATEMVVDRLPNPKPLTDGEKEIWRRVNNRVMRRLIPKMESWADYAAWGAGFAFIMLPRLKKPDAPATEAKETTMTETEATAIGVDNAT